MSWALLPPNEAASLGRAALLATGTAQDLATSVVDELVANDLEGYGSHGLIQLPRYVSSIASGDIDPTARPECLVIAPNILRVSGQRAFGHLVMQEASARLRVMATTHGLATALITDANHLGRLGVIGRMLAKPPNGVISIGFFNFSGRGARVAAPGSNIARLCTNPILVSVPVAESDPFVLDMSTTTVAEGKILAAAQAGEAIPDGWLLDGGATTNDPSALYRTEHPGTLAPLGHPHASYKGFGLGLAVELLVGALAGGGHVGAPGAPGNAGLLIALAQNAQSERIARQVIDLVIPTGGRCPGAKRTRKDMVCLPAKVIEALRIAAGQTLGKQ